MSARVPLARRVIAALFLVLLNACYSWRTTTISPIVRELPMPFWSETVRQVVVE